MTTVCVNSPLLPIQRLGNNTYYYNYIISITDSTDQEGEAIKIYEYIQVHLTGLPSYKNVVQAVLREYISQNEEFDLINSYNSYQNKLTEDDSVVTKYLEYLKLVQDIKTNVKKDLSK